MTSMGYAFDPTYGYSLEQLLTITTPKEPIDFDSFWQQRFQRAVLVSPKPQTNLLRQDHLGWNIHEIKYTSTDEITICGWLMLPSSGIVKRGFIIGHGYGGRTGPDFHLPFKDAALFFPCFRGLGLSAISSISSDPFWHVRHDIDNTDRYILGGCVDDLWLAVSSLLLLFPNLSGHIGYLGISFSGGIGALALAWEHRIAWAHFNVPTFGNHPLRLRLPSNGSAQSLQKYYLEHKKQTLKVLRYYDAALAAKRIPIPVHCACALFDPVVIPPGQFAIYNALADEKQLFVLKAGHHSYPEQQEQEQALLRELDDFFVNL
jgi:cephalosporin-C deacetylase